MPFTPTDIEPCPRSKVTVTFAGLLLLRSGADNTLEIGVHKFSRDHTFQVMLIVNKPQRPPRLIRLLAGPLVADLKMEITPRPEAGVQKFVASNTEFDRSDDNNHPLDFRWAINMQSFPRHDQIDIKEGAKPVATLNGGVLYTPNITRKGLEPLLVCNEEPTPLHRFAADLGAAIDLPGESKLTISWSELGKPVDLVLPRDPADPEGTTYTVVLVNDPLISEPAPHDELEEYYKVLDLPAEVDHCSILLPDHKTDEIPCLPVVLQPRGN